MWVTKHWMLVQYCPTAQALVAEVVLAPYRKLMGALVLGLVTFDQAVPFQNRVNVLASSDGRPHIVVQYCPTAQASLAEAALTPDSELRLVTLGLLTIDQVVPFQRRVSVSSDVHELEVQYCPAARALVAEVAVTAESGSKTLPGLGLVTFDQLVPFQRKISV